MLEKLKNVFSTFVRKTLTEEKLDDAIEDLKLLLLSNDVALDTAEEICNRIVDSFKDEQLSRFTSTSRMLFDTLKEIITEILTPDIEIDLLKEINEKKNKSEPFVILFLGSSPRRSSKNKRDSLKAEVLGRGGDFYFNELINPDSIL